jgi:hypothetical protein
MTLTFGYRPPPSKKKTCHRKMQQKIRPDSKISAGADGDPHFWVCACLILLSAPHQHQQKFFPLHMSVAFFIFSKKIEPQGGGKGSSNLCPAQFRLEVKPHATFKTPRTTTSGRKVTQAEERKKKEGGKAQLIMDT